MTDLGGGKDSPPCIVCRKQMRRIFDGGYELQPDNGLHFSTHGAYGTTAFDPMDLSSLDVIICDECIVKAGRDGIVRLSQPMIGINMEDGVAAGFYCPEREAVVWDPDTQYTRQDPTVVSYEEVGTKISRSVMWRGDAIVRAKEELERLAKEEDGT